MAYPSLRLSRPRRAGLLAAVAVYPLSRLAGTLPRPALDRALLSGMTMGVARLLGSPQCYQERIARGPDGSPLSRG